MRRKLAVDSRLARIAGRQHGVIALAQLVGAGLSSAGVTRRVHAGRLIRVHRGVYAVGHAALSNEGWWMAAVLACGEFAALSHRSAAALWGMLPPRDGAVDVTIASASGRSRRRGIRLHRSPALPAVATTKRSEIRVTTPARTLADLRRAVRPWEWRRAARQAAFDGLPIGDEGGRAHTRSDLERDFLLLCRRHRLPMPEVNVPIGPYTVDFVWRERKLIVETDGWLAHRGRQAFEDDRVRDAYLLRRGLLVLRFADHQVNEQPAAVIATLRAALHGELPSLSEGNAPD